jgi:hypothetical protein
MPEMLGFGFRASGFGKTQYWRSLKNAPLPKTLIGEESLASGRFAEARKPMA